MTVDRYTKVVLTVIALCLIWLSVGGPSLMTPVSAQDDGRVLLRGWVDENGRVMSFPAAPRILDTSREPIGDVPYPSKPRSVWALPSVQTERYERY